MKRTALVPAAAAIFALGASAAWADCQDELARLDEGVAKDGTLAPMQGSADEGVAKDGTLAPMQEGATKATPQTGGGAAAGGGEEMAKGEGEVKKSGDLTPLETNPDIATSAQDAQAQSQGGETAAAQAEGAEPGDTATKRQVAIQRALAALDAGDEAACLEAVNEAKSM